MVASSYYLRNQYEVISIQFLLLHLLLDLKDWVWVWVWVWHDLVFVSLKDLWTSSKMNAFMKTNLSNKLQNEFTCFHFIHKNQCDGFLTDMILLILILNILILKRVKMDTRMKSNSLRIFLCSLHSWTSCVMSGLMETSLSVSTIKR